MLFFMLLLWSVFYIEVIKVLVMEEDDIEERVLDNFWIVYHYLFCVLLVKYYGCPQFVLWTSVIDDVYVTVMWSVTEEAGIPHSTISQDEREAILEQEKPYKYEWKNILNDDIYWHM